MIDKAFVPRTDTLPPSQRSLWPDLAQVPSEFVLYGGTAIALHLGHRESADFDFFGDRRFDPDRLVASIPFLANAKIIQKDENTIACVVDRGGPVQVSFFGVPRLPRLALPLIAEENGLQVASLVDLAATKVSVVQKRAEAKDYIDIDAILQRTAIDLPMALSAAVLVYGSTFNPQVTLKALCYFEDGDLPGLPDLVKRNLMNAARDVDLDRLPEVGPTGPDIFEGSQG